MPLISSGIVRFKHLKDKVLRKLLVSGGPEEGLEESLDELLKLVEVVAREELTPEDVVEVEGEYEVEDDRIVWLEDSLKVKVYKPIDEVRRIRLEEVEKYKSEVEVLKGKIEKLKDEIRSIIGRLEEIEKSL